MKILNQGHRTLPLVARAFTAAAITAAALLFSGCVPSTSSMQKMMEEHPEILFGAIEKNPDKFMEVVQKAANQAQQKQAENQAKDEKERAEKELKNPLMPELSDDRAQRGPKDAPITIVEYSDFQCPFCSRGYQTAEEVLKKYDGKIRFIYKNLPLPMHPYAMPAAKRYEAINLQSPEKAIKFYHEVFKNQGELSSGGEKFLDGIAKKVGANMAKMKTDMDSEKVVSRINADMEEAKKFGFTGTPGFIVSGVSIRGAYPASAFSEIIDKKLATAKQ
jgi:protein-disulfide isomerase